MTIVQKFYKQIFRQVLDFTRKLFFFQVTIYLILECRGVEEMECVNPEP